ncbi:MAG: ornithine carbamoyltransferase [Fimbriimonadia bacterium]|nr:ornithine carbamoyltransferase [Fimbriimonadia bacterium]
MLNEFQIWQENHPPLNLISITDLDPTGVNALFSLAKKMKEGTKRGQEAWQFPRRAAVAMIFEKPSLRTRTTFEVGMYQMGGHAVYLTQQDIQMGKREAVMDVARNLGRWLSAIFARVYHHQVLFELAQHTGVPIVNALSDLEHPCQALADLMTIQEWRGEGKLELAWIGDGNNVCHSYLLLGALLGHTMRIATPPAYAPNPEIVVAAQKLARASGSQILLTHSPTEAVENADAVYTDVWVSMGMETEREIRMRAFRPFQLNEKLLARAKKEAIALHCLPARRGEEITDEVMDGPQSAIWDQAENRLHTQKALFALMIEEFVATTGKTTG